MTRSHYAWLLIAILLIPLASHAAGPSVSASGVWISAAAPGSGAMTGYLVLTNHTDKALTLTAVTSPDFGAISAGHDDADSTQTSVRLVIPAHRSVTLTPDGDHLMLMKPAQRFFYGDLVTLTLNFSDGSSLTIMTPVRQPPTAH